MQKLIFDEPEDGVRKIVLATNIAETSITINDVVFVIDCGKAKESSYDALNNTPCLLPSWISKVSAQQVSFCCGGKPFKKGIAMFVHGLPFEIFYFLSSPSLNLFWAFLFSWLLLSEVTFNQSGEWIHYQQKSFTHDLSYWILLKEELTT